MQNQGPVVQNFVSLKTSSLGPQLVTKCRLRKQIHCYFLLLKKCENHLHCIRFSHFFFQQKSVFAFEVDIHVYNQSFNDSVKLTEFLTAGPCSFKIL